MSELGKYSWGEPVGEFEGRPFYGGDCVGRMPAVYMTRLEQTSGRYPDTEEEWELFGAHLPNEITVLFDMEIGCVKYQKLLLAGFAIEDCTTCPFRSSVG
jgi:hypothetical protein